MRHLKWLPARPDMRPPQGAELLPTVCLEVVRGRSRNRFRPVQRRVFLLGRAVDCDLTLADPHFPESYAYLLRADVGVNLRWLGDGPELCVNRREVTSVVSLHDGDIVRLGAQFEFRLHIAWHQRVPDTSPVDRAAALPHLALIAASRAEAEAAPSSAAKPTPMRPWRGMRS